MVFPGGAEDAVIPPQFRPREDTLKLGKAFGKKGFAQEAARAADMPERGHNTPKDEKTDVHGNDREAVGRVTKIERSKDETVLAYAAPAARRSSSAI